MFRSLVSRVAPKSAQSVISASYSNSASQFSRSAWKGPYIDRTLLKPDPTQKIVKVMSRSSVIPYSFIDTNVLVHNGKGFQKVLITREKVGFKFGDFALTRNYTPRAPQNLKTQVKKK